MVTIMDELIKIVREAGDIAEHERKNILVETKSKGNYVTNGDKMVERFLLDALAKMISGSCLLSEESGQIGEAEYQWIVDPIDGTTNYIFGYGYCISVALYKSGDPLLGVVYSLPDKTMFFSERGKGAFRLSLNKRVLKLKKLKDFSSKDVGIIHYGMPYDQNKAPIILDYMGRLASMSSDIKRIGPSSMDVVRVATGAAVAYVEFDLKPWDIAAGEIILHEVGGVKHVWESLFLFGLPKKLSQIEDTLGLSR